MRSSEINANEALWTVREAAAFLKLGRNTVYEWAASGKLPSVRLGSLRNQYSKRGGDGTYSRILTATNCAFWSRLPGIGVVSGPQQAPPQGVGAIVGVSDGVGVFVGVQPPGAASHLDPFEPPVRVGLAERSTS